MNSSVANVMSKYDHRQHVLSDCLAELEQRLVNAIQNLKDVRKQIAAYKANQTTATAMTAATAAASQAPPSARHLYQDYDDSINFPNALCDASPATKKAIPSPTVMPALSCSAFSARKPMLALALLNRDGSWDPHRLQYFLTCRGRRVFYEGVILGERYRSFSNPLPYILPQVIIERIHTVKKIGFRLRGIMQIGK